MSFPGSNKAKYYIDTTSQQREFINAITLGEKYWSEDNFVESVAKTKQAISLGKFIVENEPEGPLKNTYITKTLEIKQRVDERQIKVKEIQQKQAQQTANKTANKTKDTDKDKLEDSIADAIMTESPNVKWEDIGGLEAAKKSLKEAIMIPKKLPQIFIGALKPWKGILLYGPPGTGKTYLAKACATESQGTFFSISASDLVSKYVGQSEKLIKTLFDLARKKQPSIIFIDEIDSLCSSREGDTSGHAKRMLTEFLKQLDGVDKSNQGVLLLGATNTPWELDFAIRRRFQRKVYIPLPQASARYGIIKRGLKENPNAITQEQFKSFSQRSQGLSGADISVMIKDMVYEPVRKFQQSQKFKRLPNGKIVCTSYYETGPNIIESHWFDLSQEDLKNVVMEPVTADDLEIALKKAKPTVDEKGLKKYEQWTQQFGLQGA